MEEEKTMHEELDEAICRVFGQAVKIKAKYPVSGGDINAAYHLILSNGEEAFLKMNAQADDSFFAAEADGLKALKKSGANTPEVLAHGKTDGKVAFLLMDFVKKARPKGEYWSLLGHGLAKLHRADATVFTKGGRYGFCQDNFIGQNRQANGPKEGWVDFFRDRRLAPQMRMAEHYFDKTDLQRCQRLLASLENYLVEPTFPSLLHGDLWSGNVMPDSEGAPMLIDPAVYVGHHEADIAMTELFGGFSPMFYDAYHEVISAESGYVDRRDLYNLYHLLNHLNLFGSSYLSSVRRIIKRYVA